jgi:hypothetical protein
MLTIKDPEAHRLAKDLAALEQTTMTEAVISALRAALAEHGHARMRRRQAIEGLIAAAREQDVAEAGSAFDDLYDESTGLPR